MENLTAIKIPSLFYHIALGSWKLIMKEYKLIRCSVWFNFYFISSTNWRLCSRQHSLNQQWQHLSLMVIYRNFDFVCKQAASGDCDRGYCTVEIDQLALYQLWAAISSVWCVERYPDGVVLSSLVSSSLFYLADYSKRESSKGEACALIRLINAFCQLAQDYLRTFIWARPSKGSRFLPEPIISIQTPRRYRKKSFRTRWKILFVAFKRMMVKNWIKFSTQISSVLPPGEEMKFNPRARGN
jgi:hypothetical protein